MNPLRFSRTFSFRLIALYAALFGTSSLVLFGVLYWIVSGALHKQIVRSVETEISILEKKPDRAALQKTIDERMRSGKYPLVYYLLQDRRGRRLAGNIPNVKPFIGWRDVSAPYPQSDTITDAPDNLKQHKALAKGTSMPDGDFLVVGKSTYLVDQPLEGIREYFFWAMGMVILLAFGGGAVLSFGFLNRIDNINRTADAIIDGNLFERIPTSGNGDELDRLAGKLNDMLDRIQVLMDSLQHISSNIAHDLRTPLGRMRQRLEIAKQGAVSGSAYDETIHQAIIDIDAILSTFGSLLKIANIEAKSRSALFGRMDLSEVFQSVGETYQPIAEDMGKYLEIAVDPGISVHGDRDLLVQMLVNLVENAIGHTPSGVTIQVDLHQTEQGPVGWIADDGQGIPGCERDKVFERFYRLDPTRTKPGNGLGLPLVRAVADLHGATISLEDNHPGAVFSIQFK